MGSIPRTTPQPCRHQSTVVARFLCEGGVTHYADWCPVCETRTSQWLSKKIVVPAQMEAAPTIDLVERRAVASQEYAARVASRERDEHPERSAEYHEYLDGPQWRERRELVMARSGGLCEGCRKHPAENVHHLGAARGGPYEHIYHEFLFELVALCRDCHKRWHRVGRYAEWEESA